MAEQNTNRKTFEVSFLNIKRYPNFYYCLLNVVYLIFKKCLEFFHLVVYPNTNTTIPQIFKQIWNVTYVLNFMKGKHF